MRRILAIISGIIIGFSMVFVGDATVHSMHPMPLGLDYMDKNIVLNYIAQIPLYVMITMSLFWISSSFLAGLTTGLIMREGWQTAALTTGGILFAACLLNLIMTAPAHPTWMWIVAIAGYLPAAFIGAWLVRKPKPEPPVI